MQLKYDKPLDIAQGNSRKTKTWKNKPVLWSELLERLKTPTRTPETMAEYKVYAHISPGGKAYVGCTGDSLQHRWRGGHGYINNPRFFSDIQKYGWGAFEHVVLCCYPTRGEAEKKEAEFIALCDLTNPEKGYNLDPGLGERSEQTRAKISAALTGVPLSEERKRRMGEYRKGKPLREETKERIRSSHKQNSKVQSHVRKLNAARRGVPKSDEHRAKIAKSQPNRRAVVNLDTGEVFESVRDAADSCFGSHPNIISVCNGKRRTAYGYRWAYKGGEGDANKT